MLNTLGCNQAAVMRVSTLPSHHRYAVYPQRFDGREGWKTVMKPLKGLIAHLLAKWCSALGQILVFVATRDQVLAVLRYLRQEGIECIAARKGGLPTEFRRAGDGRNPEKAMDEELAAFYGGSPRVAVSTSLLGAGVDIPNLEVVIHVSSPNDVIDYVQETGRCGRTAVSRRKAVSILVKCDNPFPIKVDHDSGGERLAEMWDEYCPCRREPLSEHLDGQASDCRSSGAALCDKCEWATNKVRPGYIPEDVECDNPTVAEPMGSAPPATSLRIIDQQDLESYVAERARILDAARPEHVPSSASLRAVAVTTQSPSKVAPGSDSPIAGFLNSHGSDLREGPCEAGELSLRDQFIASLLFFKRAADKEVATRARLTAEQRNDTLRALAAGIQEQCGGILRPLQGGQCIICLVFSYLPGHASSECLVHLSIPKLCPNFPNGWWAELRPWRAELKQLVAIKKRYCSSCFVPFLPRGTPWHGSRTAFQVRGRAPVDGCRTGEDDSDVQYHALGLLFFNRLPDTRKDTMDIGEKECLEILSTVGKSGNLIAVEVLSWLRGRPIPCPTWCVT